MQIREEGGLLLWVLLNICTHLDGKQRGDMWWRQIWGDTDTQCETTCCNININMYIKQTDCRLNTFIFWPLTRSCFYMNNFIIIFVPALLHPWDTFLVGVKSFLIIDLFLISDSDSHVAYILYTIPDVVVSIYVSRISFRTNKVLPNQILSNVCLYCKYLHIILLTDTVQTHFAYLLDIFCIISVYFILMILDICRTCFFFFLPP